MKKPLMWAFLLVVCTLYMMGQSIKETLLGVVFFMAVLLIGFLHYKEKEKTKWLVLLTVFFVTLIRGGHYQYERAKIDAHISEKIQQGETIQGIGVIENIKESDYTYSIEIKECKIYISQKLHSCGDIILYISKSNSRQKNQNLEVGQKIFFKGLGKAFDKARNEGNFDEEVHALGEGRCCKVISPEILVRQQAKGGTTHMQELKEKFSLILNQQLSEKDAGIALAVLTGDKDSIDEEDEKNFYAVGIGHILAVSGLHLSVLGTGCYKLLEKMGISPKARSLCSMGISFGFSIFTGSGVSALRAAVMFLVFLGAGVFGRRYDFFSSMGAAGIVLLWLRPWTIYASAFQYSFLAILGVGMAQRFKKVTFEKLHPLFQSLLISLGAWVFTLPVTLYYNFRVSWVGILLNILVIPLMTPILILLLIGVGCGLVGMPCQWIFCFVEILLGLLRGICEIGIKIPCGDILAGRPEIWHCVGYLLGVYMICHWAIRSGKQNWKSWGIFIFGVFGFVAGLLIRTSIGTQAELVMLDVGQGEGIYLCDGEDNHFFMDGGGSRKTDVGEYRILPFLESRGIGQIDGWFVSHCDSDHISGLIELLETNYSIKKLYFYKGVIQDDNYLQLVNLAKEKGVEIGYLDTKDRIATAGIEITCLNVPVETETSEVQTEEGKSQDKNAASLILKVEFLETKVTALMAGDIGIEQEKVLAQAWNLSDVEIWKVTHHGSKYSNSKELLQEMYPALSLISCGEENSYGHPHAETIERLEAVGSEILCTKESGQVTLKMYKDKIEIIQHIRRDK